jgi:serine/threonine protein kinase
MGICVVPPSICIVTEFMERGSLFRVLSVEARALSYRRRLAMAVDACAGVAFLHSCDPPIIHRDIKSLNFLVDREYRVKLADLGEARELSAAIVEGDEHLTKNRGTPHWMAPEVFLGANYNERVDVYSLGVVMWEIITSRRPFEDVSPWVRSTASVFVLCCIFLIFLCVLVVDSGCGGRASSATGAARLDSRLLC